MDWWSWRWLTHVSSTFAEPSTSSEPVTPRTHGSNCAKRYENTIRVRAWMFCKARFSAFVPPWTCKIAKWSLHVSGLHAHTYVRIPTLNLGTLPVNVVNTLIMAAVTVSMSLLRWYEPICPTKVKWHSDCLIAKPGMQGWLHGGAFRRWNWWCPCTSCETGVLKYMRSSPHCQYRAAIGPASSFGSTGRYSASPVIRCTSANTSALPSFAASTICA